MAVVANMRAYVPAPGVRDRAGLFAVANGPLDLPPHGIIGGIEFETARCDLPTGLDLNCETPPTKTFGDGPTLVTADPFLVRASLTCGAVGMTQARMEQLLMQRLQAGEQAAVERIFSEETFGATPGLAGATVVDPPCSAATQDAAATLGALEEALYATYGPTGVLHVPFAAAPYFMQAYLFVRDGMIWRTATGTAVSIGNYANESPAGVAAAAGTAWVYITGQVTIWRTPDSNLFMPTLEEALYRGLNEVRAQVEREYVVAFECGSFAVNITLCAAGA